MNGARLLYYFSSLLPCNNYWFRDLHFVPESLFYSFFSPHAKVVYLLYSISYLGVGGAVDTYGCVD